MQGLGPSGMERKSVDDLLMRSQTVLGQLYEEIREYCVVAMSTASLQHMRAICVDTVSSRRLSAALAWRWQEVVH